MGLEAALDRFCEVADARRLGIEGLHVVTDDGRVGERRWIDDIRRDAFSVSKTVTSLAVGMLAHDGLLALEDPVLMHLPELADTAAPGAEAMTVRHLLSLSTWWAYHWPAGRRTRRSSPSRKLRLSTPWRDTGRIGRDDQPGNCSSIRSRASSAPMCSGSTWEG